MTLGSNSSLSMCILENASCVVYRCTRCTATRLERVFPPQNVISGMTICKKHISFAVDPVAKQFGFRTGKRRSSIGYVVCKREMDTTTPNMVTSSGELLLQLYK